MRNQMSEETALNAFEVLKNWMRLEYKKAPMRNVLIIALVRNS